MNGIVIYFRNTTSCRPDVFLFDHYGTTDNMVITDTAETNKFINIISAVPYDFSEGFGECAETLMNENNMDMSHDALSAF